MAGKQAANNALSPYAMLRFLSKFRCALPLLLLLAYPAGLSAQQPEFARLVKLFSNLSNFDYNYPREKVYLHFDNTSYVEGETLWFKAYVVRASSLEPTQVSRVLYVELLNADGELMARKLLRITGGEASGEFKLELPVKSGFYEVRAYTREMLNWGEEACFSRVVPVFRKPAQADDFSQLDIERPLSGSDLVPGHVRPWTFSKSGDAELTLYPEGGHYVEGAPQRVAFTLTDKRGMPRDLPCRLLDGAGRELAAFRPLHEGVGSFVLPNGWQAGLSVEADNGGKRVKFPLPSAADGEYALTATQTADALNLLVQRSAQATPRLLGLAILCRDSVCYFDTLSVGASPVELEVDAEQLGDGVNRVELFDARGRSQASRFVWKQPAARLLKVDVKQNKASYDAFEPIAIELAVRDVSGQPVEAGLSLAVRDASGELSQAPAQDLMAELLLSSELKGYIPDPRFYFSAAPGAAAALDNLLMAKACAFNPFATLCGLSPFAPSQPIEDRLTLGGRLLKDNDKAIPRAGVQLYLDMYNASGHVLQSETKTDSLGAFAMASDVDFEGDWIAQFTTRLDGKPVRSRVALERWFGPQPRAFAEREMELMPSQTDAPVQADTFAWTDTIPRYNLDDGKTAFVTAKRKYKGLHGSRYNYRGGEKAGMEFASFYYNMEQHVEQVKDSGGEVGLIWDELAKKNPRFSYVAELDSDNRRYMDFLASIDDVPDAIAGLRDDNTPIYSFYYGGRPAIIVRDNDIFYQRKKGDSPMIWADEVKSIVVMTNTDAWMRLIGSLLPSTGSSPASYNPVAIFLYSQPFREAMQTRKGVEKRIIHGFAPPAAFHHPSYNGLDRPTDQDRRRTLYWNPSLRTDAAGKASAVFFNASGDDTQLRFSVRGLTQQGQLLSLDK